MNQKQQDGWDAGSAEAHKSKDDWVLREDPKSVAEHATVLAASADPGFSRQFRDSYVAAFSAVTRQRREKLEYLAQPIFDGTPTSCKSDKDFYALEHARDRVRQTAQQLLEEAQRIQRDMNDVIHKINRFGLVMLPRRSGYGYSESLLHPGNAVKFSSINSLGELQSNDLNRLCGLFAQAQDHFKEILNVLGYRVEAPKKEEPTDVGQDDTPRVANDSGNDATSSAERPAGDGDQVPS